MENLNDSKFSSFEEKKINDGSTILGGADTTTKTVLTYPGDGSGYGGTGVPNMPVNDTVADGIASGGGAYGGGKLGG